MMSRCKLSEWKLNINLLNIHLLNINNHSIISRNINKISNRHNNNTLNLGGVKIFGAEDNNNKEEEDLVEEEAKSYVITMDNQDILLNIVRVLRRPIRIVNNFIILSNNVCN